MIKCALFDLDGTLVNSIDDLAGACNLLLHKYGYKADWTLDDYKQFVGNGAKKLVSRAFGDSLDDDTLDARYAEFKTIYDEIKLNNAHAYDGIVEQLEILKSKGIKLAVITNKPDKAAKGMVEHIFGKGYFDFIIGCVDGTPVKPDPTTTKMALNALNAKPSEAIYFGDSEVDVRTAKNANVECVACSWGFRSFSTLFNENPDIIIDEPSFISKLF